MKILLLLVPILLVGCESTNNSSPATAGYEAIYGDDPMSNPDFMAAMTEFATPGEQHAQLLKSVGDWEAKGSMWMPNGAEIPMTAKATFKSILQGHYVVQDYSSEFMGMPFEGMMLMGFDNLAGEYFSIWLDNWGTSYSLTRGAAQEGSEIELIGEMRDPITPDGRRLRTTSNYISDDEMIFSMFDTRPDGSEMKIMELTYTR